MERWMDPVQAGTRCYDVRCPSGSVQTVTAISHLNVTTIATKPLYTTTQLSTALSCFKHFKVAFFLVDTWIFAPNWLFLCVMNVCTQTWLHKTWIWIEVSTLRGLLIWSCRPPSRWGLKRKLCSSVLFSECQCVSNEMVLGQCSAGECAKCCKEVR